MMRTLALFGLAAMITTAAHAQTTLHYREGERVDPQDVAQILGGTPAPEGMTRSIRLLTNEPALATASSASDRPQGGGGSGTTPNALSLPIQFEFDSATLSPAASQQLGALAEGIRRLPAERSVIIEGHTDAQGTEDYNLRLSMRRAEAVKHYLVQNYGIDAQRLKDSGYGKRQPIVGTDPYAPVNRRVQFRGA